MSKRKLFASVLAGIATLAGVSQSASDTPQIINTARAGVRNG